MEEQHYTSALYQAAAAQKAAEAQAQAAEAQEQEQKKAYWNKPLAERRAESARIHQANREAARRQEAINNLTAGRKITQVQAQAVASHIREYENTIDSLKREIDGLNQEIRGLNIDIDSKEHFLQRWSLEFNTIWSALEELAGCQFYEGSNGHAYRIIQDGQVIREKDGYASIHDVLHAALTWWKEYEGIPF